MAIQEQTRRLDNLLRLGTIAEVDYANAKARVNAGGITTDFLPWLTLRAGTAQTWSPPTVNEQCLILSVSGEFTTGIILTGVYASNAPSQNPDEHLFRFADGAEITYNHTSGHLSAKNCKTVEIHATQQITLNTPTLICSGNVEIQGGLSVKNAINGNGAITAKGEVSGKGIKLSSHTHSGVEAGNQRTGAPNGS